MHTAPIAIADGLELPRPRWRLALLALIAAVHALLVSGLWRTTTPHEPAEVFATLMVRIVAPEPAPTPANPAPALRPASRAMPPPVWAPIPAVHTNTQDPARTSTAIAAAAEPAPAMAVPVAPTASAAPPIARAAPPERQIAITQVEYLTPPALAYPPSARRLREQGQVEVRVRVDEQGRPAQVVVLRSSGSERLDEAALATVRATRFKPYTEDGIARPFWVVMPLVFELDT